MLSSMQNEILKLKKEKKITILAHSYQSHEITEIADYVGDSFQLSKLAATDKNDICIMCGVHFMAETVKILSPHKKVILANPLSGCPMAEQFEVQFIKQFKEKNPEYTIVAYINTTADLKTVADVCVTSSSAVKICSKIKNNNILFIPDCNLGSYVAKMLPEKNIKLLQGGCPVHASVTAADVDKAKELHPSALVLTHPECRPEVLQKSDYIGSTSGIIDFAANSDKKEFIIGTEISIAHHLQYQYPEKKFFILSKKIMCPNMRITSLPDVLNALNGDGGEEIILSDYIIKKASICINAMLELG